MLPVTRVMIVPTPSPRVNHAESLPTPLMSSAAPSNVLLLSNDGTFLSHSMGVQSGQPRGMQVDRQSRLRAFLSGGHDLPTDIFAGWHLIRIDHARRR